MKKLVFTLLWLTAFLTACTTARLSTGIEQYERGEYYDATQTLRAVYRKTDAREERAQKGQCAWYLGLCFEKLMIPAQAAPHFLNAQRYGYEDTSLLLHLAQAQHRMGHYAEALKYYEAYRDTLAQTGASLSSLEALISSCQQGLGEPGRYEVKRFALASGRRADFSPALWGDKDDVLYYTSSADKSTGDEKSPITGTKYSDIWSISKDDKGQWSRPVLVEGGINTAGDEGTPCFSPDGNTMYYTACGGDGQIAAPHLYASTRSEASWSKGTMLQVGKDTLSVYAHPAVSPDGKWIYFVSDAPGGEGGLDIWRGQLRTATDIAFIEPLGPAINTPGDEMFPTFAPDGRLYFSTNGRETLGGLDIYSARLDEWDTWHLEHLPAPVNSIADDFGMTFGHSKDDQWGFLASNRQQGKGYDNIYQWLLPSIKVNISGDVMDEMGQPIAEAIIRVVGRNGMNHKTLTKPDGSYEVSIDRSTQYVMMAGREGFLNRKAEFTSDPTEEDAEYAVDFYLPSVGVPVLIDNIFYDYNQATLREESYPALDELALLLRDNPYCAIELSAHTDRVGGQPFNLDLSQRRAQSVVDYLVSQGIDADRLTPVGYGKAEPKQVDEHLHELYDFLPEGQLLDEDYVNTLPQEQRDVADQINRRTEFKVLTTTWGIE